MNFFTSQVLIPIITNLIAGALMACIGMYMSKRRISVATVKGVANKAALTTAKTVLELGQYAFIFWFLITQLRNLISADGPPTRLDSFLISFWCFWLLLIFVRLLAGKSWPTQKTLD